MILAPKTMLTPQSVRIKTDMRDAYMITQCLSYGGYHAVYIPTGERKGERMEGSHELVLPNEDLSFRMFLFEGKDGNYVREKHWHRSIEMFVVLEGKLDFYINEEDIHLDKKTFVIVNSNELHSISASLPNKTIVLQMPLQTFERYYTDEQFTKKTGGVTISHLRFGDNPIRSPYYINHSGICLLRNVSY